MHMYVCSICVVHLVTLSLVTILLGSKAQDTCPKCIYLSGYRTYSLQHLQLFHNRGFNDHNNREILNFVKVVPTNHLFQYRLLFVYCTQCLSYSLCALFVSEATYKYTSSSYKTSAQRYLDDFLQESYAVTIKVFDRQTGWKHHGSDI